jgi:hypothetical protein
MKITKRQLKRIIKEELGRVLDEKMERVDEGIMDTVKGWLPGKKTSETPASEEEGASISSPEEIKAAEPALAKLIIDGLHAWIGRQRHDRAPTPWEKPADMHTGGDLQGRADAWKDLYYVIDDVKRSINKEDASRGGISYNLKNLLEPVLKSWEDEGLIVYEKPRGAVDEAGRGGPWIGYWRYKDLVAKAGERKPW